MEYREIAVTDPLAQECARAIQEHSWGLEYPVDAWDELQYAEFIVGCFDGAALAGFGAVTRVASPDEVDNGLPWLADAVVFPEYRRRGIYKVLYEMRMAYLKAKNEGLVLVCTDNPLVERFLIKRGWRLRRSAVDESGGPCAVFETDPGTAT